MLLVSVFKEIILMCSCDMLSSVYLLQQPLLLLKCVSSCDVAVTSKPAREQHRVILLSFYCSLPITLLNRPTILVATRLIL